jgi:hypothetical protein
LAREIAKIPVQDIIFTRTRDQTRIFGRLHLGSAKSAKAKLASWMKASSHPSSPPPAETGIMDRKLWFDPVTAKSLIMLKAKVLSEDEACSRQ